jgi:hypothetical protein
MKRTLKIDWNRPSFEVYINGEYNSGVYCNSWHFRGVLFLIKTFFQKSTWQHYLSRK